MPHHKFDPVTEVLMRAEELRDGMVVMMRDIWWAVSYDLENKRRLGQWCTIHKVDIVAGQFIRFVAVYPDTYVLERIHPTQVSDWYVKKDSIPINEDDKAFSDAIELARRTEIAFQLIKAGLWSLYNAGRYYNDPDPDISKRALELTDEVVKALSGEG